MQFSTVLLTLGTWVSTVDVILALATVYCLCANTWLLFITQALGTFSLLLFEKQPQMEPLLAGMCVTWLPVCIPA